MAIAVWMAAKTRSTGQTLPGTVKEERKKATTQLKYNGRKKRNSSEAAIPEFSPSLKFANAVETFWTKLNAELKRGTLLKNGPTQLT